MTDIIYELILEHDDKGIAFAAKRAFQNFTRQPNSEIKSVRMVEPTSKSGSLIITIEPDYHYKKFLEDIVKNTGRMPTGKDLWKITSINRVEDTTVQENLTRTESDYKTSLEDIAKLLAENAALKKQVDDYTRSTNTKPLELLLSYFRSLNYNLAIIMDKVVDLEFAKKIMKAETVNNFINYYNYVTSSNLKQAEIDEIEKFKSDSRELTEKETIVKTAREELAYLTSLESEKIIMPETIKKSIINMIKSKDHETTIKSYEGLVQEVQAKNQLKLIVEREKVNYKSFSENLEMLKDASSSLPIIINDSTDNLELYLPIISKKVSTGFSDDLLKDIKSYLGSNVKQISHEFLAYILNNDKEIELKIRNLISAVPLTLRLSGFDKITPYTLGN